MGHLLSHKQNNLAILFVGFAQQTAKVAQKSRLFARTAPNIFIRRLVLRKIRWLGWLITIVEKLIHGNFQCPGHLLQRFNGRNSVAILDAGDIGPEQASARSEERRVGKECRSRWSPYH